MITWTITQAGKPVASGSSDSRETAIDGLVSAAYTLTDSQPRDTAARYRLELAGEPVAEIGIPAGSNRDEIASHLEHLNHSLHQGNDERQGR